MHERAFGQVEGWINGAITFLSGVLDGTSRDSLSFYLSAGTNIYLAASYLNIKKSITT